MVHRSRCTERAALFAFWQQPDSLIGPRRCGKAARIEPPSRVRCADRSDRECGLRDSVRTADPTALFGVSEMTEFVSESIDPDGPPLAGHAPAIGEPHLPGAFVWRGQSYRACTLTASWKQSSREGGSAGGEAYLRRHVYKLLMDDGTTWTVYFARQASSSGRRSARWFLYTRESRGERK